MLCSPLGTILSGLLVTKIKIPPVYLFLVGASLQTIGVALTGTLSVSNKGVPPAQYGYQVILGLGIGLTTDLIIVAAPTVIEEKDTGMLTRTVTIRVVLLALTFAVAVFVGALTQARILGGSIGLAVTTNILHKWIKSSSDSLSSQQLSGLLESA